MGNGISTIETGDHKTCAKGADVTGSDIDLKTDVPHSARVYDYLLGGKDNFSADRAAAAEITKDWPNLPRSMRANRNFMARVARHLAAEHGIRQFLDIGTGLPTSPNLHEVDGNVLLERAVAAYDGAYRGGRMAGLLLAGVLIVWVGPTAVLFIDGATFLLSALLIRYGIPRVIHLVSAKARDTVTPTNPKPRRRFSGPAHGASRPRLHSP
jgi:hypothetical protein